MPREQFNEGREPYKANGAWGLAGLGGFGGAMYAGNRGFSLGNEGLDLSHEAWSKRSKAEWDFMDARNKRRREAADAFHQKQTADFDAWRSGRHPGVSPDFEKKRTKLRAAVRLMEDEERMYGTPKEPRGYAKFKGQLDELEASAPKGRGKMPEFEFFDDSTVNIDDLLRTKRETQAAAASMDRQASELFSRAQKWKKGGLAAAALGVGALGVYGMQKNRQGREEYQARRLKRRAAAAAMRREMGY